ncbi:MAG TPA: aspartate aminotransferase family protein [Candidatus Bathyarchaeia archaeon]|nr:aspartate aminotransferase family protein [Candidatus Bathyarchaeia archaeon]
MTSDVEAKYDKYVILSSIKKIEPVTLVEGKGATLTDSKGRKYIDAFAGISVVNSGHGNTTIIDAAKRQMDKLVHACAYIYPLQPVADLAEKIAKLLGHGLNKTFFSNSGAESIECGLKLARKFTKKHELVALMCSFHGRTIGTLSVTGQANRRGYGMGPYMSGVAFAPAPYCYRCPLGLKYPECDIQCAKMIQDVISYSTSGNVAGFIAEPVMGEGGIIVPPPEYFKEVKKILDANQVLYVADEVQSGFCRTGKMFGFEHYDVIPDIVCMAKGIANGFPLSACTTRDEIAASFDAGDHLSTFGGNPVSCAASIANIDYMLNEHLAEKSAADGEYAMKRLNELAHKHDIIGEVRGKGLMIGVELVKDQRTKTPASQEASKIRDICREKGVLIGHGGVKSNVIRIQPPLVISREQIDTVIDVLDQSLKAVSK